MASRDIAPGEQITCDYDLFELDSRDKGIERCECGADTCRGRSIGFMYLPWTAQLDMLPMLYEDTLQSWLKMNPRIFFRTVCAPAGCAIKRSVVQAADGQSEESLQVVAVRRFLAGELLFSYETEQFNSGDYDTMLLRTTVLNEQDLASTTSTSAPTTQLTGEVTVDQGREFWREPIVIVKMLDPLRHSVNRGDGIREFYGFDTFGDHSCDPNVSFVYVNGRRNRQTESRARRTIEPGEVLLYKPRLMHKLYNCIFLIF